MPLIVSVVLWFVLAYSSYSVLYRIPGAGLLRRPHAIANRAAWWITAASLLHTAGRLQIRQAWHGAT